MTFLLAVGTLWKRELIRFIRQKGRLFGAFGTPLIFWFLLGSGFGSSFQSANSEPGVNYLEYFYPGTILLIILFTAIFSSLSIIEDRKEGFLLSVLVAPVSRAAIVLGKTLGATSLAFIQGVLLLFFAPLLGITLSLTKILMLLATLFLLSFGISALGFATAWKTETMQGYHSIMNVLLFPMWLLSGAVFPAEGAFTWIRWIMALNPLTYGLSILRHILYQDSLLEHAGGPSLLVSVAVTIVFGLVMFLLSMSLATRGKVVGVE